MITKIPIISSPLTYKDFFGALLRTRGSSCSERLSVALSSLTRSKYIYLTCSGISSFYVILKILKENSQKNEVILPAYTAGSLVTAVIKAGLKPVLCDITLEDFNLDRGSLFGVISPDTLAVVAVHMFGIGIKDIESLRGRIPQNIFMIEDCAQAMGSKINGSYIGGFGDLSLFSFNRGKNLPLYGGGCITTNNEKIALKVKEEIKNIKGKGFFLESLLPFKILAYSLALNPYVYGLGNAFISGFKDVAPPKDFFIGKINNFQIGLGLMFINKIEELFSTRYQNGMYLASALKDVKGIIFPKITETIWPVFSRFPILCEDLDKRETIEKKLWAKGIETSRMYVKPLHHMFNLGYKKNDFSNACYLAEHLLTLPVHPLIKQKALSMMVEIIRET